jgi:hypothetical protein
MKISEMPDAIIGKLAERVHEEQARRNAIARGQRCSPLDAPTHPAPPCNGRNATGQMDHAVTIGNIVRQLAHRFCWCDDFMLMINVAKSTPWILRFDVTSTVRIAVPEGLLRLLKGDTLFADIGSMHTELRPLVEDATGRRADRTEREAVRMVEIKRKVRVMDGEWKDPYAELRARHPFAQPSDYDAILKWEAGRTNVVADDSGECRSLKSSVKAALPNAMVVRGGHDTAGWSK